MFCLCFVFDALFPCIFFGSPYRCLVFLEIMRKAFCTLSLASKSSVFFSFFLYRHLDKIRSPCYLSISIYVFGIAFSQALVIQFVNSVAAFFEFLKRLDDFISISLWCSISQSVFRRLYDDLSNFSYRRLVLVSSFNSIMIWSLLVSLSIIFLLIFLSLSISFSAVILILIS